MLRSALLLAAVCAFAGCATPSAPSPEAAPELTPVEQHDDAVDLGALEGEADQHAAIGRRDLAAPLYARLIELRALREERAPESRALAELAVIEHDRGHLDEAERFYRRALAEEFAEGGRDPGLRTRTLANLAWLLGERAAWSVEIRRADAIELYQEALEIWQTLQPASDELVAETLANLALLYRARGNHEHARALLARAVPLYEKTLAPGDPEVVRVRALLAASGAPSDPEPDPAEIARNLDREGTAHLDRREYVHAKALLERAVSIHERGVTTRVELGASLSYLGRTYAALGDRENARYVLQRSLTILVPELGKFDPLTLATRASLENLRGPVPASAP